MCLLTFMHEGVTPNIDDLTIGAENNPDGFGFAIHDRTSIVSFSSLNYELVLEKFLQARRTMSGPALFHSRITTHGGTSVENCHPFTLGGDPLTVMAHNGMLPIDAANGRSDTRILAEDLMPQWGGARILNLKSKRKKLSKFADGSKLVFLSANPDVQNDWYIINERDGHWSNGVWWSNSSYKWKRSAYSYSGSGMYTSGWGRVDHTPTPKDDDTWAIQDLSYTDRDGHEVWAELWTCMACGEQDYFDEDTINCADYCHSCDSCWFCSEPRLLCACVHDTKRQDWEVDVDWNPLDEETTSEPTGALIIPNYDSTYDYF